MQLFISLVLLRALAIQFTSCRAYFNVRRIRRVRQYPHPLKTVFSGLTVQCVIFYRTLDISQRCKTAFAIMIFATIITVPLESISIGFNRQVTLFSNELTRVNGCLSLVPADAFNVGPVYYLAHL